MAEGNRETEIARVRASERDEDHEEQTKRTSNFSCAFSGVCVATDECGTTNECAVMGHFMREAS